jgi:hypothetical protein
MTDTPQDFSTFTPEQATAELQRMSEALHGPPAAQREAQTPTEARAKLDALTANKEWADRLVAGGVEERRQFKELTELASGTDDRLGNVLKGESAPPMIEITHDGNPLTTANLKTAVEDFRALGFDDVDVTAAINGDKATREFHDQVAQLKAHRMRDQEFVSRYLRGDPDAVLFMSYANLILSLDVVEASA